jgi:multiple sugar transport system permease protein
LQSIPPQLYEAASIDGAGAGSVPHVTMPMLSPYILFNAIIGVIGTMQIFGEAYIMTQGGPADSTLFYAYYLFKQAFQYFRMGYASALAWILFVIVLALTLLQLWLSKRWVHYELEWADPARGGCVPSDAGVRRDQRRDRRSHRAA